MAGGAGFIRDMMISLELNRALKKEIRNQKMLNHGKMKYQKQAFIHGHEASEDELSILRTQLYADQQRLKKRKMVLYSVLIISGFILTLFLFYTIS